MLYTTDFSGFAPENPISEGGAWTNTVSATWTNPVHTLASPFRAVGAGVSSNDAVAMLTGTWGPDQTVSARCYVGSAPVSGEEIELHLRMTMIPGGTDNIHSYEIDIIPALGELVIARWNSFQGDFTVLATFAPVSSISSIADNDLFVASISGPASAALIIVTQNGVEIGRVTDTAGFTTGSPGIGMDNDTANIFGWRTYTATDGVSTDVPTKIGPFRVPTGPRQRRRAPQKFADTFPTITETTQVVRRPTRRGRGPGFGPGLRRTLPQRYPEVTAISTIVIAGLGAWNWTGKQSSLSIEIVSKIGAYSWAGKQSPLSIEIVSILGQYTWSGKSASLSKIIAETVGVYSWSGSTSRLSKIIAEVLASYTWRGPTSVVTVPGASGSTIVFYDGLNVANGLTYHKGLSRPTIILIPVGDGTYTVTKLTDVTDERVGVLKETVLIDGDIP